MTHQKQIIEIVYRYFPFAGYDKANFLADEILSLPIEVPSEEEIEIQAFRDIPIFILEDHPDAGDVNEGCRDSAIEFAKWMRNEILKRNKIE